MESKSSTSVRVQYAVIGALSHISASGVAHSRPVAMVSSCLLMEQNAPPS